MFRKAVNHDNKRKVWSTYSSAGIDYWFRDDTKMFFLYEYQLGDSGVNGAGDSETAQTGIRLYY